MNALIRYQPEGRTAAAISGDIEREIRRGRLRPGDQLPAVRNLAADLAISPGTVAAAYRTLRSRGIAVGDGRRGTRIAPGLAGHLMPMALLEPAPPPSTDVRDLATGNPDPALLPDLRAHLAAIVAGPAPVGRLYGEPAQGPELVGLARAAFTADGIPAQAVAVVGGALDGIERVLEAHLRPGDRVAVEDPGYPGVLDLVTALGLVAHPMAGDDEGPDPAAMDRALAAGAEALIVTPRAQNPTGAAFSEGRAGDLREVLRRHPDALVVEDDHAGLVAGAPCLTLVDERRARWAVVRSMSKALGPDLRLAVLAADELTVARVEGRRQLGAGWVSHLLQQLVVGLWSDPAVLRDCELASDAYRDRRTALIEALGRHGLAARGASGLNVWVPVPEEQPAVAGLLAAGWAVQAGERYRRRSRPAIRITTATLLPAEADEVAAEVARSLLPSGTTRLG